MAVPTSETSARIKEAARMVVEGATWAVIATHYGYASADSACATLAREHRDEWRAAIDEARTIYHGTIEAEAVLTMRQLLRPYREIIKPDGTKAHQEIPISTTQSAAHSLMSLAVRDRAQKIEHSGGVEHSGVVRFEWAAEGEVDPDAVEPDTAK